MEADIARPLFGVVGSPIGHSKSPALHRAAYEAIAFDADYDLNEVAEGGLSAFLRASPPSRRGLSVTMPLKREAWSAADVRDRPADLTGAVNTLVRSEDGRLSGANTDVAGIVGAVSGAGDREVGHVLVIGGGATAGSAIVAAADLGAHALTLAVRTPERAAAAADLARSLGLATDVRSLGELPYVTADVVISTLPGGTVLPALPTAALVPGSLVLDVAYAPWPSVLVAAGLAERVTVVHGLSMLVHQAARQVRLFASLDDAAWRDVERRVTRAMFGVVGVAESGVVAPPS